MERQPEYLVRYGLMGHVGWFPLDLRRCHGAEIERGQAVVVLTDRGVELGEVMVAPGRSSPQGGKASESEDARSLPLQPLRLTPK